mmetsp:Transcript_9183/g.20453  ORF Transcript_9183/g.20453 Transcript_9183/m.20453 type:complete len:287 (-) Transcript_9183:114-974(-)|eukprot:CAMPEP_0178384262 /NCGR_PEP_ID=MMETSP0689_2-20121128/7425_1 /TAXON_ID=160604 /ORGANISM="Amphidinium massartii, Strain CS-259" /LENGTH=286 /DNA_ID=CAMNT_0020004505 /DNA_START=1 /DNA_END=861 /DNA_ORIENTATION=+
MPQVTVNEADVPRELCCAATLKPLYMPVVTLEGVAYSYVALFAMFMKSGGSPKCRKTGEPIRFFPAPCAPLQHYLLTYHNKVTRSRGKEDEAQLMDQFGLAMPEISAVPEASDDASWLEELECKVTGELAYKPCVLSSGTIVSRSAVPDNGFMKDPDRTIACALHGQAPLPSPAIEFVMKKCFPEEYAASGRQHGAPEEDPAAAVLHRLVWKPSDYVHWGLGCDGCGMFPIVGAAWCDEKCPQKVGFHLCNACHEVGYSKRTLAGRFDQAHIPQTKLVKVPELQPF